MIHKEYSHKAQSDTCIVFVHGIQGSPWQFNYLIDALDNKYSVENLLLPGHGYTAKEFSQTSMQEWQSYVDKRIQRLEKEYANIVIVGHSMGGLLAVQSALSFPDKIKGLFLLALPLVVNMRYRFIRNSLIIGFSNRNDDEVIAAARKANSISTKSAFEYLACTPRYIELLKKSYTTRKLLIKLSVPVTIIQSSDDEIVSNRSLQYVKPYSNIKALIVEDSGHYYYPKTAKEFIVNELFAFLSCIIST
ncbi:MAG TPA: alpha/beta fold hydrolase [Clostridiales bacterium]|nr:alpha/beta fold hydrolase [Clostridiales bacterium]